MVVQQRSKSAEATMKVMADLESPTSPVHSKPGPFGSTSAVKRGFSHVKKTTQRATSSVHAPSFPALPSTRSSSSPIRRGNSPLSLTLPASKAKHGHSPTGSIAALPAGFTVQDIQTTHRLLSEQWDRQCYRLDQYLNRNLCLLNNVPVDMEIEDEKFERPGSVGSIGKMLEQVKYDTTPKANKDEYFSSTQDGLDLTLHQTKSSDTTSTKNAMSFKQFILESGPQTPSSPEDWDLEGRAKQLRLDTNMDNFEEPRTPTQQGFSAQAALTTSIQ